jgi:hypothetical protein
MTIIKIKPQDNGAHQNQSGDFFEIPEGYAAIPDELISVWEDYKPFVIVEIEDGKIVSMVDNPEAREAAITPPLPQLPTLEERTTALENALLALI